MELTIPFAVGFLGAMENIPDRSGMYRERGLRVKRLTRHSLTCQRTPSPAPPIMQGPLTTSELSISQLPVSVALEMDPLAPNMGPLVWRPPPGDSRDLRRDSLPTSHLSSRSSSTNLTTLETMCMGSDLLHDQDKDGMGVKCERLIKGFFGRDSCKEQEPAMD
ncbi:hypothetical protein M9H77_34839 [Catharanthus roseus]|uniref:Uncharacterized protein n=1 Tax=Catharanthus roseus TaxID=4058 RepID=A0ACB9ZN70_CATRO|nr:hypothetical protein M9H77_34839 [Catharanthus roseus]